MKRFKGTAQDAIDYALDEIGFRYAFSFLEDWREEDVLHQEYHGYYSWLEDRYSKTMAELDEERGEEIG